MLFRRIADDVNPTLVNFKILLQAANLKKRKKTHLLTVMSVLFLSDSYLHLIKRKP